MSDLPVLTSPLLDLPGVRHAFFTRQGGVSTGIYASLNVGVGSKDDPEAVVENRRRAAAHLGGQLVTAYQVHSATTLVADGAWPDGPPQADGVVSATAGVVCGALAADCAPILFADAEARVVAAAHAGWKGALTGVAESAIARMESLGARREHIVAAVGPCIGPSSYEVGLEYVARFTEVDPGYARFFAAGAAPDKRQFDLPAFVLMRLKAAGIERCEWVGRDTCAEPDLFFSNRRAFKQGEPDYGRLLSAIVLT
ncbi:MAG: peptidoglycan editing factor PgeF [Alphaproteobacteria bacterium]|nr:peptidoglycan editing factor PgeF [Alphaproteobacteria bacterium]MBU1515701.1 peptidoglycan editing factor PgeF [Alphaproteobacteria bacterium]MBU2096984.1 peptidoglycan editing factor PgeF [Alphaproteobacteria bacterium]MBU2149500.1 peptidoglycan editing factor PgeF [Alphaproteobacteria bacterium]MBU2308886.1 peptidoglycan editing factor PgeF [Alphaproteobacteria bacterium]